MPTPQGVTMSPKSSVPQAASSVSQVMMSDKPDKQTKGKTTHAIPQTFWHRIYTVTIQYANVLM
jgi:hypothetical protein